MYQGFHPIEVNAMLESNSLTAGFEAQLKRMALLTTISRLESCLEIYSYLMVFGKTTPAKLREKTRISKATVFRHLSKLSKAGLIDKEADPDVKDKRYDVHYFVAEPLMEVSKHLYSKELKDYADTHGKSQVVTEWIRTIETLPLTLNKLISNLMLSMRHQEPTGVRVDCRKVIKVLAFRLRDETDFNQVQEKIKRLLADLDSQQVQSRRDWKKPLQRPMTVLINVVVLDPDESCDEPILRIKKEIE